MPKKQAEPSAGRVFQLRADGDFIAQLDDLRRADPALPSRAAVIRQLVADAHGKLRRKAKA